MSHYIDVKQTAELIKRSPKAVYSMIERGQLKGARKFQGRILINKKVLLEYIEDECSVISSQEAKL